MIIWIPEGPAQRAYEAMVMEFQLRGHLDSDDPVCVAFNEAMLKVLPKALKERARIINHVFGGPALNSEQRADIERKYRMPWWVYGLLALILLRAIYLVGNS